MISQCVAKHGLEQPNKIAVASLDWQLTYKELATGMKRVAAQLSRAGIGRGDTLLLKTSTSPDFVVTYLATHWIGAIAVPIDPRIAPANLDYIDRQVKPRQLPHPIDWSCGPEAPFRGGSLDDTSDILFTSGTTGTPKGVVLTHRATLCAATQINAFIGNGPDDREVVPLPLSHSFGLGRMRCNFLLGATLLLCDGLYKIRDYFDLIERWEATGTALVPAAIVILLRLAEPKLAELSNQIRYMEIGSAPMPIEHKERLCALFPKSRCCMHYGLTEASRAAFLCFQESRDQLESIGRPSPGVEMRVEADPGEIGPLFVRGGMVMKGYWGESDFSGDWLRTGDVGRQSEDGTFYLAGRESEIVNVGGLKVAPVEIDRILMSHPAVRDCACVGVPDPAGICGQIVRVYLVAEESEVPTDELCTFLRERIEPYKVPTQFIWVGEIPKTASGKVQRGQLVESRL